MQKDTHSISEFINKFPISRTTLYKLWGNGEGPEFFFVGRRRLISQCAIDKWVKTFRHGTLEGH